MCKDRALCSKVFTVLLPGKDYTPFRGSKYTIYINGGHAKLTKSGSGKLMRMLRYTKASGLCAALERQESLL